MNFGAIWKTKKWGKTKIVLNGSRQFHFMHKKDDT